jgi:peptide/nickel transport system substrate-binding protein
MRYSIERALSPELDIAAQGFAFASDIAGAKAFHEGEADHVAGIRVEGDLLHITLARPAPDFPSRISVPFFTAVPLGTPIFRHGVEQPIPSAGPYYLSSNISGTQQVLRSNPSYEGPRPQRLDGIVIANTVPVEAGADRVERGKADYTFADAMPLPPDFAPGGSLDRRFGPESAAANDGRHRYFFPPQSAIEWLTFNTRRGVFRDARLRRAVNYALDRPALAALTQSIPSDALIPPGIPGAGGKAVYPLDGPDVPKPGHSHGERAAKQCFSSSQASSAPRALRPQRS